MQFLFYIFGVFFQIEFIDLVMRGHEEVFTATVISVLMTLQINKHQYLPLLYNMLFSTVDMLYVDVGLATTKTKNRAAYFAEQTYL